MVKILTTLLFLLFTVVCNAQPVKLYHANVQHGTYTNGTFNYAGQANILSANNTDIVDGNEVSTGSDLTAWNNAFSSNGFSNAIFDEHPSGGDGNAIWYRTSTVSLIQTYTHDLEPAGGSPILGWDGSDIRRSTVAAKFSKNGFQFYVVSFHACAARCEDNSNTNFAAQRVTQISDLISWINSTLTGGLPIYIMGDFNMPMNYPRGTEKSYTADASTDTITSTAHGFSNGMLVVIRNSGGVAPSPLLIGDSLYALATVYWVRDVTANTFKLAATPTGSAIDITTNGTGSNFIVATQFSLFVEAGYTNFWQSGIENSLATANWGDRDANSIPDMPLGFQTQTTRTHDSRTIDYIIGKGTGYSLQSIDLPDLRATCSVALTTGGNFKQCPDVTTLIDFPDDQGVRPSDHNWLTATVMQSSGTVPTISNVTSIKPSDTTVGISITTNIPSYCYADYGINTSYGNQTRIVTTHFFTDHFISITGLTNSTLYHYKITCTSAANNSSSDIDKTFTTQSSSPTNPRLPTPLNPNDLDMSGANVRLVRVSGGHYTLSQLQNAINDSIAASGKQIIDIQAGQTITGSYSVGVKVDGACIQFRSSAFASLPAGKRITSVDVANLATIKTNNPADPSAAAITTTSASKCTDFLGIAFTMDSSVIADAPGGNSQTGIIKLGPDNATSQSQLPQNWSFRRCWIFGILTKNTRRGIYINAENTIIIDSTIEKFQDANGDSQAILVGTAKGLLVWNSFVQSAGENVLSGGVGQTISGYATSDLEFRYCVFPWILEYKTNDPSYIGINYSTKNNFEIKKGERVLLYASQIGPWWDSEQVGGSLSFKTSNDDPDPIVIAKDILIYKNRFWNVGALMVINGSNNVAEESTDHTRRISLLQNLAIIDGITSDQESTGNPSSGNILSMFTSYQSPGAVQHYPDDIAIEHNTFVNGRGGNRQIHNFDIPLSGVSKANGFIYRDNVQTYNQFGIKAGGTAEGTASLDAVVESTDRVWDFNLIAGSSASYPASSNIYVTAPTDLQFISYNSGLAGGNFRLSSSSAGHLSASDGTDIGVDNDDLERAITNTLSGDWRATAITIKKCNWHTNPKCNQ